MTNTSLKTVMSVFLHTHLKFPLWNKIIGPNRFCHSEKAINKWVGLFIILTIQLRIHPALVSISSKWISTDWRKRWVELVTVTSDSTVSYQNTFLCRKQKNNCNFILTHVNIPQKIKLMIWHLHIYYIPTQKAHNMSLIAFPNRGPHWLLAIPLSLWFAVISASVPHHMKCASRKGHHKSGYILSSCQYYGLMLMIADREDGIWKNY